MLVAPRDKGKAKLYQDCACNEGGVQSRKAINLMEKGELGDFSEYFKQESARIYQETEYRSNTYQETDIDIKMEDGQDYNDNLMGMLITMLECRRLRQMETEADLERLQEMVAERTNVLNQLRQPRNQLTREQSDQLDVDNTRFTLLKIRINVLRSQIRAGTESVERIETMFRSSICDSAMIEVNDEISATYVSYLYDTDLWAGTVSICTTTVPDDVRQQILVQIEGIPRMFFTRDEEGNIE
ncbi:hypothetical protein ACET3Z_000106 [Daucus carota]